MNSSRALALAALARWRQRTEFADKIAAELLGASTLSSSDRAFTLELFYGVLRNLTLLDFWIGQLRTERVAPAARDLLRLGLYQILILETPAHAAVFETVELTGPRARGLINAILRRALREQASLTNAAEAQPLAVRFSTPAFLIDKWSRQYAANEVLELCRWNNRPATNYARINALQVSAPEFLSRYPASVPLPDRANFVELPAPGAALASGDCYLQDPSTALACELLRPTAGETVLDACAAPGGKAAYLAEMMQNQGELVAADREEHRLERVRENFVRLGVRNARLVPCDWRNPDSVRSSGLAEGSFDKILVDVPCSNTGVMRRRVDVRWRLRSEDFIRMPQQQLAIMRAVAPLLRPGGSLVYSTCSLEPEENDDVVEAFLRELPGFRLTASERSWPFRDGIDGAFAARLERD